MRRGGRSTLSVDLDVPDLPEGRLAVLTPHFENRTKPKNRQKQMAEILTWVKPVSNPVIIGGDLNTLGGDAQSFKLERQLVKKFGDADFWVNQSVKWSTGVGAAYDVFRGGVNWTRNVSDPTRQSIPFFFPNKEKGLFNMVEAFRFEEGKAFDFRGDEERTSSGYAGYLSNSSERASKGFTYTYQWVIKFHVIGTLKLDWIFVKSYLEHPTDKKGPYQFAPHFARTMVTLNNCLPTELSDHNPMTVDLPFDEPIIDPPKKAKTR